MQAELKGREGTDEGLKVVERDEFCQLLVGFRNLVRCDDARNGLWGLLDPVTGERYVIPESDLFRRN